VDFALTDQQEAVRDLSAQIFEGLATTERVKAVEATDDRVDRELWGELARANLLGIALPEEVGGSGLGIMELCLLLEQQGRRLAPVPLLATLVMVGLPIAEFGTPEQRSAWLPGLTSGEVILTAALSEPGDGWAGWPSTSASTCAQGGWQVSGTRLSVPAAHVAARVLVPARMDEQSVGLFLVDPTGPGVGLTRAETTNREIVAHLTLDGAPADLLGDGGAGSHVVEWLLPRVLVGICALQVGVAEEAVRQAATYTSGRRQFGKPLSTFQGVALKAGDAYIDTEAMRVTMWQAAWRLAIGDDAGMEVEVAKWWAADAGQRIVHATQHLHGGLGADVDYPIHRYFLWGKQLEDLLGGAGYHLARLGHRLAEAAEVRQ
jgi:alkylation response protein AidB-like acyl-CoA dehydrogenase